MSYFGSKCLYLGFILGSVEPVKIYPSFPCHKMLPNISLSNMTAVMLIENVLFNSHKGIMKVLFPIPQKCGHPAGLLLVIDLSTGLRTNVSVPLQTKLQVFRVRTNDNIPFKPK